MTQKEKRPHAGAVILASGGGGENRTRPILLGSIADTAARLRPYPIGYPSTGALEIGSINAGSSFFGTFTRVDTG